MQGDGGQRGPGGDPGEPGQPVRTLLVSVLIYTVIYIQCNYVYGDVNMLHINHSQEVHVAFHLPTHYIQYNT